MCESRRSRIFSLRRDRAMLPSDAPPGRARRADLLNALEERVSRGWLARGCAWCPRMNRADEPPTSDFAAC
jgi:hypothetical protein